jgi:hypothetical protein
MRLQRIARLLLTHVPAGTKTVPRSSSWTQVYVLGCDGEPCQTTTMEAVRVKNAPRVWRDIEGAVGNGKESAAQSVSKNAVVRANLQSCGESLHRRGLGGPAGEDPGRFASLASSVTVDKRCLGRGRNGARRAVLEAFPMTCDWHLPRGLANQNHALGFPGRQLI